MKAKAIAALLLLCLLAGGCAGCASQIQAVNLMEGITAAAGTGRPADDRFLGAQADLSAKLFRAAAAESRGENVLISPLSIQLALTMTANGAAGETRREMEALLGGGMPLGTLNEYLSAYADALPSGEGYKLALANSIWLRDTPTLRVEKDFLQTNADYYGAQVYKAAFDGQTLRDINEWVRQNTDGSIDRVLEELPDEARLYLINTLSFDAEWEAGYKAADVRSGTFTALSGERRRAELMHSTESRYLNDGSATGFVKDYKGGKYSFAALLPNEGVELYDYIDALTGEKLLQTLADAKPISVEAAIPQFDCAYELELNAMLETFGIRRAFDEMQADFTAMAVSDEGNLYIGTAKHQTFIRIDRTGTKAGAATTVEMMNFSFGDPPAVTLDRPFVYMILDNATGLPILDRRRHGHTGLTFPAGRAYCERVRPLFSSDKIFLKAYQQIRRFRDLYIETNPKGGERLWNGTRSSNATQKRFSASPVKNRRTGRRPRTCRSPFWPNFAKCHGRRRRLRIWTAISTASA